MKNAKNKFTFTILKYSPIEGNCFNVVHKKNVTLYRASLNACLDYLRKIYPSKENFKIEY